MCSVSYPMQSFKVLWLPSWHGAIYLKFSISDPFRGMKKLLQTRSLYNVLPFLVLIYYRSPIAGHFLCNHNCRAGFHFVAWVPILEWHYCRASFYFVLRGFLFCSDITAEQVSILYCVGSYFGVVFPVWIAKSYFLVVWITWIENMYACSDGGYQIILYISQQFFIASCFEHHSVTDRMDGSKMKQLDIHEYHIKSLIEKWLWLHRNMHAHLGYGLLKNNLGPLRR